MQTTDKTAKEIFHDVMANPQRVALAKKLCWSM